MPEVPGTAGVINQEHIRSPLSPPSPAAAPWCCHKNATCFLIPVQLSPNRVEKHRSSPSQPRSSRRKAFCSSNKRAFVPTYGELERCFAKFARECLFFSLAPTMCWVSALNRGCENRPAAAGRRDRIHRKAIVCGEAFVSRHLCVLQF